MSENTSSKTEHLSTTAMVLGACLALTTMFGSFTSCTQAKNTSEDQVRMAMAKIEFVVKQTELVRAQTTLVAMEHANLVLQSQEQQVVVVPGPVR